MTMGYGSFGNVKKLPTLGYGIDASALESDTTLVIARGTSRSRLSVTQAQSEMVLVDGSVVAVATETTLIETK